jgi:hypothetical protein
MGSESESYSEAKVSPRLKATVGLMKMEAVEFAI